MDRPRGGARPLSGLTTLYLVRHGESEANAAAVFAGQTDSPLTARGREQAAVVASALRPVHFDRIVSSTLSRTRDTAAKIAAGRGIPVETFADLQEIDLGEAAGKPFDEVRGLPGYERDGFHQWPGGESLEQVVERAMRVIDRLVAEGPGTTICIVGHGGVTRILVSKFMDVLPKLIRVPATNTNVTIVTHDAERGYVVQEMFNDAHVA
ncbi:MAG TPA: histidine phosphatase family protein [Candidatus Limnocylindria bacterium]|nr:histidine phosphatase family protein [Candidatus Limnocylindria bacterium]